jgi:hypothetical protein
MIPKKKQQNTKEDEFRTQQNSYSVDRAKPNYYELNKTEDKKDNLSFESLNPGNNSFTLGGR